MTLKFYTSVAKELKLKVRKFRRLVPAFVEITGKNCYGGFSHPFPLPILHKVKGKNTEKIFLFITSVLDLVKLYSLRLYTSFFCLAENNVVCSHSRLKFDKHF